MISYLENVLNLFRLIVRVLKWMETKVRNQSNNLLYALKNDPQ